MEVKFSGSFLSYMKSCFSEVDLSKFLSDVKKQIKDKLPNKNYNILITDKYYDYEHTIKIKLINEDYVYERVVDIPTILREYDTAVMILSDVSKDVV